MYLCSLKLVLEAINASALPVSHGRLLHAVFLNIIREYRNELSGQIHDEQIKRFSNGVLRTKVKLVRNTYYFKPQDIASWHIAVIGEDVLKALSVLKVGRRLSIGNCEFLVKDIICDNEIDRHTGITSMADMRNNVFSLPVMRSLTMSFLTPTTFRYYDSDMPFPRQELIFSSLAEKWNSFSDEEHFDIALIKELATMLVPEHWQGESRRVNITKDRGVTGFVGTFCYNMSMLPEEHRYLFILLAEFAVFTGVGRLTGQGMGQVSIEYNM